MARRRRHARRNLVRNFYNRSLTATHVDQMNPPQVVDGSKNVLVMFHTPDCGHCKVMEPEYEAAAEILTTSDEIVLARVDTEAAPGEQR